MIAVKVATMKHGGDSGKLLNVSSGAIKAARVVREQATPELVQAVEFKRF